jgi:hypothetical protein
MTEHRVPGEHETAIAVGQELGPDAVSDAVLPAVVKERTDGSERYIAYSAAVDGDGVENYWISVNLDVVVSRELWR